MPHGRIHSGMSRDFQSKTDFHRVDQFYIRVTDLVHVTTHASKFGRRAVHPVLFRRVFWSQYWLTNSENI
jgi:hypothetical protein